MVPLSLCNMCRSLSAEIAKLSEPNIHGRHSSAARYCDNQSRPDGMIGRNEVITTPKIAQTILTASQLGTPPIR
jgi:hypothetical protein